MPFGSLTGATIMGGGSLLGGLFGANAAQNAANTQANAELQAAQIQQNMFNTINAQNAPQRAAGYGALNQLGALGAGGQTYDANGNPTGTQTGTGYLTHQFNAQDLTNSLAPNYDFMLQQGQMANQRAANAAGGGLSGNALQGLNQFTQNYAGNAYQNAFNNYQSQRSGIFNTLAGIAGLGQTANDTTATSGTNVASGIAQSTANIGAAQAAGTVGATNAITGSLTGASNAYFLNNLLNNQNTNYTPYSTPVTPVSQLNYNLSPSQPLNNFGANDLKY